MTWTPASLSPEYWFDVPTEIARSPHVDGTHISGLNDATDLGAANITENFAYSDGPLPSPWAAWVQAPTETKWTVKSGKAVPPAGAAFPISMHPMFELDPFSSTHEFDLTWDSDVDFLYWPKVDGNSNGYYVKWNHTAENVAIGKYTPSTSTDLATSAALATALRTGTHHWKVVCSGDAITVYDENNNQIVTVSDSTWTAGPYFMLEASTIAAGGTSLAVDNIAINSVRSHRYTLSNWNTSQTAVPKVVNSGIGGLPSLSYDGTSLQVLALGDNLLTTPGAATVGNGSPVTVLVVCDDVASTPTNQTVYCRTNSPSNWQTSSSTWVVARNGWLVDTNTWNDGIGDSYKTLSTLLAGSGSPHSVVHRCDGTNAGNRLYVDGTAQTAATNPQGQDPANSATGRFYLGSLGSQATTAFKGRIAEVVVVPRAITDLERAQWDAYVQAKYGIAISDPTATAALALSGSGTASAVTSGAGSVALVAAGSTAAPERASASVGLSAAGAASAAPTVAPALLLAAAATAATSVTATGALSLAADGGAEALVQPVGVMDLQGAANAAAPVVALAGLDLLAVGSALAAVTSEAVLTLLGEAAAVGHLGKPAAIVAGIRRNTAIGSTVTIRGMMSGSDKAVGVISGSDVAVAAMSGQDSP